MIKDLYIQRASLVHELDFWAKILSLLVFFPLAAFLASPPLLILIGSILIGLLILSKIGVKKFWNRTKSYLIAISVGLLALSLLFTPGSLQFKILEGVELSIRFASLITFGMLFSMVTNPIEIPTGFLRAKLPHKYGVTLMVGYRMMPLLTDKISSIMSAQKSRGASFKFSLKTPNKFFKQMLSLVVPLLHATLEMSVRLSDALISRGYNPEGKITVPNRKLSKTDLGLIFLSITTLVISIIK